MVKKLEEILNSKKKKKEKETRGEEQEFVLTFFLCIVDHWFKRSAGGCCLAASLTFWFLRVAGLFACLVCLPEKGRRGSGVDTGLKC